MDVSTAPASGRGGGHRAELGLACAGLYGLVGLLAFRVRGGTAPLRVDLAVSRLVGEVRPGGLLPGHHLRLWPAGLGHELVDWAFPLGAVVVALALAGLAWYRHDLRAAALCLLGPALAVLATDSVLKPLVDRHHGGGLAYPSGHATGAAAVAALAVLLFHRWRGWRAAAWFAPVALALPAAMGLALVRLRYHYPTDVVGGTAMGVATVVAVAVLLDVHRLAGPVVDGAAGGG